jgi:hypothetical protein
MPPPNASDRPPPRPACSRISAMSPSDKRIWIEMTMASSTEDL